MAHKADFEGEVRCQTPDAKSIKCKDCVYRDRSVIEISGKVIPVGVTKAYCKMYIGNPHDAGKPNDVLFRNADCEFYKK